MIRMKSTTWMDTKAVQAAVHEASLKPLEKCALAVRNEAVKSMKQGGKIEGAKGMPHAYYNSDLKRWVIASAPRRPPHSQTKTLRNSIRHAATWKGTFVVGPTTVAWYGRVHEFGSVNHAPRPFMRPALYRAIYKFTGFFKGMDLGKTRAGRHLARARRLKGAA